MARGEDEQPELRLVRDTDGFQPGPRHARSGVRRAAGGRRTRPGAPAAGAPGTPGDAGVDPAPGSAARADPGAAAAHGAGTQLLRLEARALEAYATRPPDTFAGFAALLEDLLPLDDAAEARVARGVGCDLADLRRLRLGVVDALTLPPVVVAALGRTLALTFDQLAGLLALDRARLRAFDRAGLARGGRGADDGAPRRLRALRDAWDAQATFEHPDWDEEP